MFPQIYGILSQGGIDYLFLDNFTIDQAAPVTVPFATDSGLGAWEVATTPASYSISGELLNLVASGSSDLRGYNGAGTLTRVPIGNGVVAVFKIDTYISGNRLFIGIVQSSIFGFDGNNAVNAGKSLVGTVAGDDGDRYMVTGTTRQMLIVNDELVAVFGFDVPSYSAVYMQVRSVGAANELLSKVGLATPHGNWDNIEGMRTNVIATPTTETFTANKDIHYYFRVDTLPSAGSVSVAFREQDTSNRWEINIDNVGVMTLDEVVAGSPTTRITIVGVLPGDVVMVRANDETIAMMRHVHLQTMQNYTGAANFKTETAGRIVSLGTGGVISDFETWDTFISGDDLGRLEAI